LLWALSRVGYDRRGLLLESAIALVLLGVSRLFSPALNLNYAYRDPLFHRSWGPAPLHVGIIFAGFLGIVYWPTHLMLARFLSPARRS